MSSHHHHHQENSVPLRKNPPENKSSLLLTKEENQIIFDILGKGRQTLATAVVQLLSPTPDQSHWQIKDIGGAGVLCLVRDTTRRSYFIQVLSLKSKTMVYRQEIYNQFDYQMSKPYFITFEGDNFVVGINFADVSEAANFKDALDNKLESKRQRKERRSRYLAESQTQNNNVIFTPKFSNSEMSYTNGNNNNNHHKINEISSPMPGAGVPYTVSTSLPALGKKPKGKDKVNDKHKIKKEDIGLPTDFRHVQHVGWNPGTGFDLAGTVDTDLKSFFQKAGISANELQDEKTSRFIYDFIDQHGGMDAVKREVQSPTRPPPPGSMSNHSTPPPPPPPSAISAPVSVSSLNPPPPPVPARQPTPNKNTGPPPPRPNPPSSSQSPGGSAPPPPRRTTSNSNVPQKHVTNQKPRGPGAQHKPSPSAGISNGPPPPPPPPIGGAPPPPPPPPPPPAPIHDDEPDVGSGRSQPRSESNLPVVDDSRSALLDAIKNRPTLKKVDPAGTRKPTDTNTELLKEIRDRPALKHVTEPLNKNPPQLDGLAAALAAALKERQDAINPDTDSSEEENLEDDDEWE